jgi:hypothetical protein
MSRQYKSIDQVHQRLVLFGRHLLFTTKKVTAANNGGHQRLLSSLTKRTVSLLHPKMFKCDPSMNNIGHVGSSLQYNHHSPTPSDHHRKSFSTCTNSTRADYDDIPMMTPRQLWSAMSPLTRDLAHAIAKATYHCDEKDFLEGTDDRDNLPASSDVESQARQDMHPRVAISRAITLMESKHPFKKKQGDVLLTYLLSLAASQDGTTTENSHDDDDSKKRQRNQAQFMSSLSGTLRVGFAGPPGAGKTSQLLSDGPHENFHRAWFS